MLLFFLSDIFHQFRIILNIYNVLVFLLSDLFYHISCHKSYLFDLFHQVLCQYYIYHFWNLILPVSKCLYHKLISLYYFHQFFSIMLCYIFIICYILPLFLSCLIHPVEFHLPHISNYFLYHFILNPYFYI